MSVSMTAAEQRIRKLLDDGSFVEIGAGIRTGAQSNEGVVTGYGSVDGCLVYVISQDNAVLGGSVGAAHARKISNIYRLAVNVGAPVITIVDSAGLRLDEAQDALSAFGNTLKEQAQASGVIPQIMAVFGSCGGGMAVSAAMSDFVFMESDNAGLFISSPDAVRDNYTGKLNTAGALFQSENTGVADFAGTEDEIIAAIRKLVAVLPSSNDADYSETACSDDLNRSVAGISAGDIPAAAAMLSDDGFYFEVKAAHAKAAVTAFIRINGRTVGIVANAAPELDHYAVKKIIHFVNFCDAFGIAVLNLVNTEGPARDVDNERNLARALAKLIFTYSKVTSPLVTVITGSAYGTAGLAMASRSLGADMVFAWKDAKLGLMDAKILEKAGISSDNSAASACAGGYIDAVIAPEETRQQVAAALEMLYTKNISVPSRRHGTV